MDSSASRSAIIALLGEVERRLRVVEGMVEREEECVHIMKELIYLRKAMAQAGTLVAKAHLDRSLGTALRRGNEGQEPIRGLQDLFILVGKLWCLPCREERSRDGGESS